MRQAWSGNARPGLVGVWLGRRGVARHGNARLGAAGTEGGSGQEVTALTAAAQRWCAATDCDRAVHSGGLYCAGHAKRIERGNTSSAPLRENLTLRGRCMDKVIALADADSEDEEAYERAWDALEHAVKDWAKYMHQSRAGKARWLGTTAQERSDFMRALVSLRYGATSLARKSVKGKRRAWRRGSNI